MTDEIDSIDELSKTSKLKLKTKGFNNLSDFKNIYFPDIYSVLTFEQSKILLKILIDKKIPFHFACPKWDSKEWSLFVHQLVKANIVSWKEIAITVCGELNPPQVGTAIASSKSFQAKFPPREIMKHVMQWLYSQEGKCSICGTKLFLEADHIKAKQEFIESGKSPEDADTLDNLQLLCKRCNVVKRPSHALGGISFGPAQSVLIWILLHHAPDTKEQFYKLCRDHGLTMANIRFDEAWAFAVWLKKEGKYHIS